MKYLVVLLLLAGCDLSDYYPKDKKCLYNIYYKDVKITEDCISCYLGNYEEKGFYFEKTDLYCGESE